MKTAVQTTRSPSFLNRYIGTISNAFVSIVTGVHVEVSLDHILTRTTTWQPILGFKTLDVNSIAKTELMSLMKKKILYVFQGILTDISNIKALCLIHSWSREISNTNIVNIDS